MRIVREIARAAGESSVTYTAVMQALSLASIIIRLAMEVYRLLHHGKIPAITKANKRDRERKDSGKM